MSEVRLPEGWEQVKLGACASKITKGSTPTTYGHDYQPTGIPFVRIENLKDGRIDRTSISAFIDDQANETLKRSQLESGDLLISIAGTIGRSALVEDDDVPSNTNQALAIIRGTGRVFNPDFLRYSLSGSGVQTQAKSEQRGGALQNISLTDVRELRVPLPPLNEQRRIVAKIEELSARSRAAKQALDAIPPLLERFRQSVLAAAFRGDLTKQWRTEQSLGIENWEKCTLGSIVNRIESGKNVRCIEVPPSGSEKGLVKISAVSWGRYNENESKTLPEGTDVPPETLIKEGDFLISRANTIELVGACVLVENTQKNLHLSDKVLRLVMEDRMKTWVLNFLRSPHGRSSLEAKASGNQHSMRNLSRTSLLSIEIPIPSDTERAEILNRIERYFELLSVLGTVQQSKSKMVQLDQSILAKAFRGELVPQDPNDEPASALLARIHSKRGS